MCISRRSRYLGHVEWPVVHGNVRFDENPVLEPRDLQVLSERLDDAGEVTERQ